MKNLCLGFIFYKLLFLIEAQEGCISGFTSVNGTCYKIIRVIGGPAAARRLCQQLGKDVDLATIRCDQENQAIVELFWNDKLLVEQRKLDIEESLGTAWYLRDLWIGLHDIKPRAANSGVWHNEPLVIFRNWAPGEPQNRGPVVHFDLDGNFNWKRGSWYDMWVKHANWGAVCEQTTTTTGYGCMVNPPQPPPPPPPPTNEAKCSVC